MKKTVYLSPIGAGLFNVVVVDEADNEELNLEETHLTSELVDIDQHMGCECCADITHEHLDVDGVDDAMDFQMRNSETTMLVERINELKRKEKELNQLKSLILGK